MNDHQLHNWIPYKLVNAAGGLQCHWLNTFEKKFTEPFFEETILKCRFMNNQHAKMASVSDVPVLNEWATNIDAVEPAAFIFHISRCGSTLVSQLLATSVNNIVLAEVPFFDDLLRLPFSQPGIAENADPASLAAAIKFYGQKKTGSENRLFVKTDSWHLFFYEQIRQLYPQVPFIFIYRRPDEVFRSHSLKRGMHAVPGLIEPQVFGFNPAETDHYDFDQYLAAVLEKYLGKYMDIAETDKLSLFVNYNEGPMPLIKKIAAFLNLDISGPDWLTMTERSFYHSKTGERFYQEAPVQAPSRLNRAMELYRLLDEKRIRNG